MTTPLGAARSLLERELGLIRLAADKEVGFLSTRDLGTLAREVAEIEKLISRVPPPPEGKSDVDMTKLEVEDVRTLERLLSEHANQTTPRPAWAST